MIYGQLSPEAFDSLASRILYEDNHLLIINKRVGEIVQGDKTGDEPLCDSLKAFIAQRDGKPGRVFMGVPHRLDRPVSGIAVFAKTSKALERLNEAFRSGDIHKTYWALTCAAPSPAEGELENKLLRNEKQNKSYICNNDNPAAKLARLRYRTLRQFDRYTLVEVERPEIRRGPQQPRRRHLSACAQHHPHASDPQRACDSGGSGRLAALRAGINHPF